MSDDLFDWGSILVIKLIEFGRSNFLIPYTLTGNSGFALCHSKAMELSDEIYDIKQKLCLLVKYLFS